MLLMIDNYDSFTYNLVQYFGELGEDVRVARNDEITVEQIAALAPDRLCISPGPCSPAEAGVSLAAIAAFAGKLPILGVCLGHQAIGHAFGGQVVRAGRLMHGKTTDVVHDESGVFEGLPSPLTVMRYHSLVIAPATVTPELEVCGWSSDRPAGQEIMAVRHRTRPVHGVQFHPESVGTHHGRTLLSNFLRSAGYDVAVPAGTSS